VQVTQGGQTTPVIETDADGNVIFDLDLGSERDKYSGRLPEYHRLDVRMSAHAGYWDLDWTFYLDVINVYNHSNVLTYQQFINPDLTVGREPVTMLPLLPTLGFSVRF
jgi:hypothetical protein